MSKDFLSIVTEGINFDAPVTAVTKNKDGETITIKVTDAEDRKIINRVKAFTAAAGKLNINTAYDIKELCDRRTVVTKEDGTIQYVTAKDRYGVGSAEGLNELFNLGIGKENSRAWVNVARKFLHRDTEGKVTYNANVPELPVSTLVHMCALVTENEDGTYNYDAFDKFITDNGITSLTSQGTVRRLLPSKGKPKVVDGKATVKPIAIPTDKTSRADNLTATISAWEIVSKYIIAYIDPSEWKGLSKSMEQIKGVIESETNARNSEMGGEQDAKWSKA